MSPRPISAVFIHFENGNELVIEDGRLILQDNIHGFPDENGSYSPVDDAFGPGGEYEFPEDETWF